MDRKCTILGIIVRFRQSKLPTNIQCLSSLHAVDLCAGQCRLSSNYFDHLLLLLPGYYYNYYYRIIVIIIIIIIIVIFIFFAHQHKSAGVKIEAKQIKWLQLLLEMRGRV